MLNDDDYGIKSEIKAFDTPPMILDKTNKPKLNKLKFGGLTLLGGSAIASLISADFALLVDVAIPFGTTGLTIPAVLLMLMTDSMKFDKFEKALESKYYHTTELSISAMLDIYTQYTLSRITSKPTFYEIKNGKDELFPYSTFVFETTKVNKKKETTMRFENSFFKTENDLPEVIKKELMRSRDIISSIDLNTIESNAQAFTNVTRTARKVTKVLEKDSSETAIIASISTLRNMNSHIAKIANMKTSSKVFRELNKLEKENGFAPLTSESYDII